eukprot:5079134-Ditylum_brightwellii.AAC.1
MANKPWIRNWIPRDRQHAATPPPRRASMVLPTMVLPPLNISMIRRRTWVGGFGNHYWYTGGDGEWDGDVAVAPQTVIHVEVDPSVKVIGQRAFIHCKDLVSVHIPEGVEVVGEWAFVGCEKLAD